MILTAQRTRQTEHGTAVSYGHGNCSNSSVQFRIARIALSSFSEFFHSDNAESNTSRLLFLMMASGSVANTDIVSLSSDFFRNFEECRCGLAPSAPADPDAEPSSLEWNFSANRKEASNHSVSGLVDVPDDVYSVTTPVNNNGVFRDSQDAWITGYEWVSSGSDFRPGDILEFLRDSAVGNHWAVYLGNELVVHVEDSKKLHIPVGSLLVVGTLASIPGAAVALSFGLLGSMYLTECRRLESRTMAVKMGNRALTVSPESVLGTVQESFFVRIDPLLRVAGKDMFRVNNQMFMNKKHDERNFEEIFDLVYEHVNRPFAYDAVISSDEHYAAYLRYRTRECEEEAPVDGPPSAAWWND